MKRFLCTAMFGCLIFLTGCGQRDRGMNLSSHLQDDVSGKAVFVSGMGCSDSNCTDPTHHHDCPPDCGDYEHYHNCDLNCTETSHHHNGMSDGNESGQHHEEQHHGGGHH